MSALDLADLQGNILRAYPHHHAAYLFVTVDRAGAGRRWLGGLVDAVTHAARDAGPGTLNVALTFAGLEALEVDPAALAGFPDEFRTGMAVRAHELGDVGPSAPGRWDDGLGTGDAHVLLIVYASDPDARDTLLREHAARVRSAGGLDVAHIQPADAWPDAREHFGFADGFSQPAVQGSGRPPAGEGVLRRLGGWRELRLGEFVLGHLDEDGVVAGAGAALLRNGTFMVWRKLAQDVALFREWLRELAGDDPREQERIAAKVVGRWRDGGSLVDSPAEPAPASRENAFLYADDRDGLQCPLGAHVRRANPRDSLGWRTERTKRHRLIRRGMPYGPRLPDDARGDDGQPRGLVFVCLNASIARQFELVQAHWLLDGDAFGLGADRDLLLAPADPAGKMTVPGGRPRFLGPQRQLVTTRGGEYLFVPGIAALRSLTG